MVVSPHVAQDKVVEAFVLHVTTEVDSGLCNFKDSRWSLLGSVNCSPVKFFTVFVASNTGLKPLFGF